MIGNILWLSLTNIERKKLGFILIFMMTSYTSSALFLINISRTLLWLPEINEIRRLFSTVVFSLLILSILLLAVVSFAFISIRKREFGILRIWGVRKVDILFLSSLEVLLVSFAGALTGLFCIILLILFDVLYLPSFFTGIKGARLIKLIGIGGQTVFGVVLLELTISSLRLLALLKNDIQDLVRGSF